MTTKITIDKHLAEYCIGKWGDGETKIVSFPTNTDLYITIYDLLIKRPIDCQTDNGTLEFKLPVRRANEDYGFRKNPEIYNYLSKRSCRTLNKRIRNLMWAEFHEIMEDINHRPSELDFECIFNIEIVHWFRCKYMIESISEDAFLKNYYRWREVLRRRKKRAYEKRKNT